MKTFYEIIKQVSNMRWSIDDPEPTSFAEVQMNLKQAVQQAHSYIWGRDDFPFKQVTETVVLPEGEDSLEAPKGNIVNIMLQDADNYLEYAEMTDFLKDVRGVPEKYWVESRPEGNVLKFYPRADKSYYVQERYDTLYKARDKSGGLIYNLENADDVLNIPPEYEETYIAALKPMAIYYLISDNTDENFQPYWQQFEQQYANLKNLTGRKINTRFVM